MQGSEGIIDKDYEKVINRISDEVSSTAGKSARELLGAELLSKDDLWASISQYDEVIERATSGREDIDVNLAHSISLACVNLLENSWDPAIEVERRLIQMACCYYFEEDDDENGDFDSVFGFDDDAIVLNIVLEIIGREELTVLI